MPSTRSLEVNQLRISRIAMLPGRRQFVEAGQPRQLLEGLDTRLPLFAGQAERRGPRQTESVLRLSLQSHVPAFSGRSVVEIESNVFGHQLPLRILFTVIESDDRRHSDLSAAHALVQDAGEFKSCLSGVVVSSSAILSGSGDGIKHSIRESSQQAGAASTKSTDATSEASTGSSLIAAGSFILAKRLSVRFDSGTPDWYPRFCERAARLPGQEHKLSVRPLCFGQVPLQRLPHQLRCLAVPVSARFATSKVVANFIELANANRCRIPLAKTAANRYPGHGCHGCVALAENQFELFERQKLSRFRRLPKCGVVGLPIPGQQLQFRPHIDDDTVEAIETSCCGVGRRK